MPESSEINPPILYPVPPILCSTNISANPTNSPANLTNSPVNPTNSPAKSTNSPGNSTSKFHQYCSQLISATPPILPDISCKLLFHQIICSLLLLFHARPTTPHLGILVLALLPLVKLNYIIKSATDLIMYIKEVTIHS